MGRSRIGISGWTYPRWRGDFYPAALPQRRELAYVAERLGSVEVNGSFYALQRPSSYATWRDQTPDDFVFALKGGRFITHMKRLVGVETALANFFASGVLALGPQLGPVLWQLPETLPFDEERLDEFLGLLPRTTAQAAALAGRHDEKVAADRALTAAEDDRPVRHALEMRHDSYRTAAASALLRGHDVACVWSDSAGRWPSFDEDTAGFRYVRLHGHTELYSSGYAGRTLDDWARRCREWTGDRDVYVYFDNDVRGRAPWDALSLQERLAELG